MKLARRCRLAVPRRAGSWDRRSSPAGGEAGVFTRGIDVGASGSFLNGVGAYV
jgi:hypothetical protein